MNTLPFIDFQAVKIELLLSYYPVTVRSRLRMHDTIERLWTGLDGKSLIVVIFSKHKNKTDYL